MAWDAELLLRDAKAGDDAALGRLLDSYSRYFTLLARVQIGRRLQGKVDAADVVQETFLEAHRQIAQFRGGSEAEFTAWLRRILAGRLALVQRQFLGTRSRDIQLEQSLEVELSQTSAMLDGGLAASTSTPSQHVSKGEQARLLADALDRLPPDYREVIILRNLEGLSLGEVGARMNRTKDSCQKLWVRALTLLRGALENPA